MAAIVISSFTGLNPKTDPELLRNEEAQIAQGVKLNTGKLSSAKGSAPVLSIPKSNPKTIYRFGQTDNELQYWFSFSGDVNVVKGAVDGDTSERTFYTGDGFPKVTNSQLALTGGINYPVSFLRLGVPRPVGKITATSPPFVAVPNSAEAVPASEFRVYEVCYVNSFGEQGPPNLASDVIEVFEGKAVTLTNIPGAPSGPYNITSKRIFRSASGATGSVLRFVAEVAVGVTTFTDNVPTGSLGEVLVSDDYTMPPDGLQGLTMMANGIYAGFLGSDLYFTPPYLPFAFPERYVLSVDSPVVGIAQLGQSLFVGTKANPYIIVGSDPENFSQIKLPDRQACVSKRSIVTMMGGAIYASPDGLQLATEGGVRPLTENLLTRDQWQAYNPSSMHAYELNGQYIAFYENPQGRGRLVFDFTGKQATLTTSSQYSTAGYSDRFTDQLYTITDQVISKEDAGAVQNMVYRSKRYRHAMPLSYAFGQIESDTYPLTMTLYVNGVRQTSITVSNPDPFRLPEGLFGRVWEIEISGQVPQASPIKVVAIAQSTMELQQQ